MKLIHRSTALQKGDAHHTARKRELLDILTTLSLMLTPFRGKQKPLQRRQSIRHPLTERVSLSSFESHKTIDSNSPKDFSSARPFATSPFFTPFSYRISRTHSCSVQVCPIFMFSYSANATLRNNTEYSRAAVHFGSAVLSTPVGTWRVSCCASWVEVWVSN